MKVGDIDWIQACLATIVHLTCGHDNSKPQSQFSFKLGTHMYFFQGEDTYFKVTLNFQCLRSDGYLLGQCKPCSSQTVLPI